ncbi:nucleic acid dioxygenase ALKBH1-like [Xenia sp. Carnegie-2017]|uniref:nucleic acid dioxygenase ALKBH1-like n=1 Tax=Xenia sp. Carnegie-2017 TaxID=2897299 RepID=UPI001F04EC50|nr:nucleic acid dioxygenase ALKBH1-like [Xenia sp. Carnegie-2017]
MADDFPKFRLEFKRYKRRNPPPDFSDVIDFDRKDSWRGRVKKCSCPFEEVDDLNIRELGLSEIKTWKCHKILGHDGFLVIVNPFTSSGQLQWIEKSVKVYPMKPNVCNLDAHYERNDKNLWTEYEKACSSDSACAQEKTTKTLMEKLRWVTLGYHYNWNTKEYHKASYTPFPNDLSKLTTYFACALGYESFIPEAAILNYYHMNSTLSGHTDHSELDLSAPLFSLSFGQTCIFLLGGRTLDEQPCAVYLRSGDVVVMSRESRLSYHGVPRILENENLSTLFTDESQREPSAVKLDLKSLKKYLNHSRININVRQVEGPTMRFS